MAKPQDPTDDDAAEAAPAKSKLKPMIMMGVGALMLVAGSVTTTWFLVAGSQPPAEVAEGEEAEAAEKPAKGDKKAKDKKAKKGKQGKDAEPTPTVYLALDPPFVVNSQDPGTVRYLQVSVEVMAREPQIIEDVKKHMPVIRNSLVLLLSSQSTSDVNTREGKETLRQAALGEVQKIMQKQTGKNGVEDLYFTSFVMQ